MNVERRQAPECELPFPVYGDLIERLLATHRPSAGGRVDAPDPTVAHTLATCAGYAYADLETMATMAARLGLSGSGCVRVSAAVDAMFIFSTAYLLQSRCGRVVVLCYRGTEPTNLAQWVGDADTAVETIRLDAESVGMHAGFARNMRATRWAVIRELSHALKGRSLGDPNEAVANPMEALFVTGHSLGGAMAALFALSVAGSHELAQMNERMRAVYTFGQPMALAEPLPDIARTVGQRLFRHVMARDIIPALPPRRWGSFAHFGHEYHLAAGRWERSEAPTAQIDSMREIPRSLVSLIAPAKHRAASRFSIAEHGPHHYIAALRPRDRVTEHGDRW